MKLQIIYEEKLLSHSQDDWNPPIQSIKSQMRAGTKSGRNTDERLLLRGQMGVGSVVVSLNFMILCMTKFLLIVSMGSR